MAASGAGGAGALLELAKPPWDSTHPAGLGLLQAQRDWWAWWFIWSAMCILAYSTNPTAASFRTHLTSLSFSTHLRRLSTNCPNPPPPRPSATRSSSNGSPAKGPAPSHVLSFSNRISVAVRTPAYTLKSYYFFSTVVMQPAPPSLTAGKKKGSAGAGREGEVWVGAFGRWYPWRWESDEAEEQERKGRLTSGVIGMDVEEDSLKDDTSPAGTPANSTDQDSVDLNNNLASSSKPAPGSSRTARPSKRVLRGGQRRSSPTSLARLRAKAESSSSPATPTLTTSINDTTTNSISRSGDPKPTTRPRDGSRSVKDGDSTFPPAPNQRVPGHFSFNSNSTSAESLAAVAAAAVAAEDSDPVLLELKAQLDELRATAAETERRLQDELEVLRGRKRDEDNFRAELKAKTKQLEEQKRVAELQRVEAERELNERKAKLREARERVAKLQDEISQIDRRELEAEERREKKKRDRKEREKKLREDVVKKRELLKQAETEMGSLRSRLISVEKNVEIRRELLLSRKTDISRAVNTAPPFHPNQLPSAGFQPNNGFRRTPGQVSAPFGGHVLPHHAHLHANMGIGPPPGMLNFNHSNQASSRPSSIRSGHFDHNPQQYQSAPSSPVLTQPLMVNEDGPVSYQTAPAVNTTDPFYGGVFAPDAFRPQHASHQGFLEHRIQHRTDHGPNGVSLYPVQDQAFGQVQQGQGGLPSTEDILHASFLPFDFESPEPGSRHSTDDGGQRRHPLALPMQYLNSGLLAGPMSPGEGPLSPMTPHQTSLIPSQLFHMLDEDDEDDHFVMPDSPTLVGRGRDNWMGLGLDVNDLGAPASTSSAPQTKSLLADLHENSQPATEENLTAAPLSPIGDEPRSPLGPVSPMSEKSEPRAMSLLPSPPAANGTAAGSTRVSNSPSNPQEHLASVFGFAPSPWDSTDQLLSSRLSPATLEAVTADDLPRAGLSLNPDAKAFAFQPPQSADAARAAFAFNSKANTTVPGLKAAATASAGSPTVSAFNSVIGPPAKSRMDFAQPQGQAQQPGKAGSGSGSGSPSPVAGAAGASGLSTGFAFDWQKGTTSPAASDASPPPSAGLGRASFDPWNSDNLLGPLK